jgi:hypothetical protein
VAGAIAAAFDRAAGLSTSAPPSGEAARRGAAAYRRGRAVRAYLDDPTRRGDGLVGGFDRFFVRNADQSASSEVVTFDLYGASPDTVDYAAAADSLVRLVAASREGRRFSAPFVALAVDVPGMSAASVAERLADRLAAGVSSGEISADELAALRAGWLPLERAALGAPAGPVDADAFHAWLAKEKGAAWSLGKNFVLSILTQDESRWKVSRSDYIRVLQLLLPGVAIHVTHDLQEFLKSQQVLEIQA